MPTFVRTAVASASSRSRIMAVVAMATTADIFKIEENEVIGNWRELSMSKYNIQTREL